MKVVKRTTAAEELVPVTEAPLGMMDFVLAISYDDDVQDVVIYKAMDFGKYNVVTVE